jgi:addiction module HigA family antidote
MPIAPHPGIELKQLLRQCNLRIGFFSQHVGVSRITLHNILAGKSAITPLMALRLEKALGGQATYWLDQQMRHDLANAYKTNRAEVDCILPVVSPEKQDA